MRLCVSRPDVFPASCRFSNFVDVRFNVELYTELVITHANRFPVLLFEVIPCLPCGLFFGYSESVSFDGFDVYAFVPFKQSVEEVCYLFSPLVHIVPADNVSACSNIRFSVVEIHNAVPLPPVALSRSFALDIRPVSPSQLPGQHISQPLRSLPLFDHKIGILAPDTRNKPLKRIQNPFDDPRFVPVHRPEDVLPGFA